MNRFQYINSNIDRIKIEVRMGIISSCVIKIFAIYAKYDIYRQQGYPVTQAVFFASEDFQVSEVWVYKVIKNMESEL
jgi:hypothetical protein